MNTHFLAYAIYLNKQRKTSNFESVSALIAEKDLISSRP
jgi:hypothetical protein